MDIMKLASQLLAAKLNNASQTNNSDALQSVLGNLLGNGQQKNIDLGSLVGSLKNSGLDDIAKSWLGDDDNQSISKSQIENLLGAEKVTQAATDLGIDSRDLLAGLQDMLPQVVDKSSRGGDLLDSLGGLSGLAGLAKKFLK